MNQPRHPLDVPLEFSDEDYDPDDPNQELLYEADGTPLDAKRLAELEREAEEGTYTPGKPIFVQSPGRPSLSEAGASPRVQFRVPNDLRERAGWYSSQVTSDPFKTQCRCTTTALG